MLSRGSPGKEASHRGHILLDSDEVTHPEQVKPYRQSTEWCPPGRVGRAGPCYQQGQDAVPYGARFHVQLGAPWDWTLMLLGRKLSSHSAVRIGTSGTISAIPSSCVRNSPHLESYHGHV